MIEILSTSGKSSIEIENRERASFIDIRVVAGRAPNLGGKPRPGDGQKAFDCIE